MESDKQAKSARKRRRPGTDPNTSESALSDDASPKPYSIRSRRQTKHTSDDASGSQSGNEKEVPSPSSSPVVPASDSYPKPPITASPLQQATRELHARIMSRVRDLAPSLTTATSKPPAQIPTPPSTPKINTDTPPTTVQAAPSPTNTTRTVKELQHLISQYVQQQRANLGIPPNTGSISPTSTPNINNASGYAPPRNIPTAPNGATLRAPTDPNYLRGMSNDTSFQKSSIIANKFNNAITKYARASNAPNATTTTSTNNFSNHPATGSHFPVNGSKQFNQVIGTGHDGGSSIPRSTASFTRPVSSVLEKHVPALSIQYKHNQQEKRRKTEYGYYDDTSSNSSDGNSNYFLLAAQHELQNMDEEMATIERLELMESEIERLQRGIAMRDRVIKKLRDEIEEKDEIIRALPYELVSNWVAASHMMMGQ